MKKLISLILVFCMAVMLVPALAESADIAGEWIASFAGNDIPMTINADGFKLESIIKLVPPALMLWCANNVKNQTNL